MQTLHDRAALEATLSHDPALHLYELGDLDDDYWPRTTWYGSGDEVALVYAAPGLAVLLAFSEQQAAMRTLLGELLPFLPRRFYAHLSPGLAEALQGPYTSEFHGRYQRMVLADPAALACVDTSACEPIGPANVAEVMAFYAAAYPGNWFDPRMLSTNQYFVIRQNGELAAIAGVHVYSPRYGVAALGNITVRPDLRGQSLGTTVTARTCQSLARRARVIGLNVHRENAAAIRCYAKLGFIVRAEFEEHMLQARDRITGE